MNKKVIRFTEGDLRSIVKESVSRILKEGYYDFDDDFNADDIECPSCGSNNVEPISAIDTHYRCLDCGEEFYLDGGWEPDWGAMRHESHKHKGNMLKETNDPNQEGYYDPNVEAKRDELIGKVNSYVKQRELYTCWQ